MLWRGLPAYAAFAVALLAGCQRDISGYYAASDSSAVIWLQVVRTPDNHFDGSVSSKCLEGRTGLSEQDSESITGTVDGDSVD